VSGLSERDALIRRLMALCDSGGWLSVYVEHAADDLLPWLAAIRDEAKAEAWDEGYSAGQRTDVAAETQAQNPYRAPLLDGGGQ
jgi:hypothetical protein